jgi:hypothetical protein
LLLTPDDVEGRDGENEDLGYFSACRVAGEDAGGKESLVKTRVFSFVFLGETNFYVVMHVNNKYTILLSHLPQKVLVNCRCQIADHG